MTQDFNATWQVFEGVDVLRVGSFNDIAIPATGKKSSAKFLVIAADTREIQCQLTKKEVHTWLFKAARSEIQDIEIKASIRETRLANVQAYLAKRAARARVEQMAFTF